MEDNKKKPLIFPVQCPAVYEYFSGFGPKELGIVLISVVIATIVMIIIWITTNEALAVIVAFCIIAITFIFTRRNIHQESIIDQLKQIYKYHRAQKKYEYEYHDELGVINMAKQTKRTANDLTNVRDIKDIYLYTKNGYILCYLKVHKYNIELLSKEEKAAKTSMLVRSFESDKKNFAYFSLPRELDLDHYKQNLKELRSSYVNDYGRKRILNELLVQAVELETNGENYDHQHYIKIWHFIEGDIKEVERSLRSRIYEFKNFYEMAGIKTEILTMNEIIKMCNLYGNARQAPFDVPIHPTYEPVMFIR